MPCEGGGGGRGRGFYSPPRPRRQVGWGWCPVPAPGSCPTVFRPSHPSRNWPPETCAPRVARPRPGGCGVLRCPRPLTAGPAGAVCVCAPRAAFLCFGDKEGRWGRCARPPRGDRLRPPPAGRSGSQAGRESVRDRPLRSCGLRLGEARVGFRSDDGMAVGVCSGRP